MRKLRTLPAAADPVARLSTRSGGPPQPTAKAVRDFGVAFARGPWRPRNHTMSASITIFLNHS
jgi:hypothetical protein